MSSRHRHLSFPPPQPVELVLLLDRVELSAAILLDERGGAITIPMERLPSNPPPERGDLIRVPLGDARRPLWRLASVEPSARRRAAAGPPAGA
jgi:hypothetical protein